MNIRKDYVKAAIVALSGASMLALSMNPVSAQTVFAPALELNGATVELAGYYGHGGYGHGGYGGYGGHGYYGYGHGYGYYGNSYYGSGYDYPYYPQTPCYYDSCYN